MAVEIIFPQIVEPNSTELLSHYFKTTLAQFVSVAKEITRSFSELRLDFNRYYEEETMKRGESSFLRNTDKLLLLAQLKAFLQRSIFASEALR